MSSPTVSCIMPTRDRREFIAQSIGYFLRQDYPERELLIVDDGKRDINDLIPGDQRVRYVRLEKPHSLGEKRNIGNELARGELIAHWDDDDWMAADRLSRQVHELSAAEADICGTRELLYYNPGAGQAWRYQYPELQRPWLAGGTLIYRRELWSRNPFPHITVGEDSAFVRRLGSAKFHAMRDASFYVGIIHQANACGKNTAGPRWERRSMSEVTQLLAEDRGFYIRMRGGALGGETQRQGPDVVNVAAHFDVTTGYGSMAEYAAMGMARAGANVNVVPLALHLEGTLPEFQELVRRSKAEPGAPTVYCSWPRPELTRFYANPNLFLYTMWESAQLPKGWAAEMNRARGMMVPSKFVARVFREGGVQVPIEVVPEGVDPQVYYPVERERRAGLTTLTVGPVDDRKHVMEGIAAWKAVFADDPEARLIIKTSYGYHNYTPDDPRIEYVDKVERTRGILHWYRRADVLLALGNEGFGLPLIEAMATGLPVIALRSEGQLDVCRDAPGLMLPVDPASWEEYYSRAFGRCGLRGVPAVDDVARQLRWVAEHRREAREMGKAASEWVFKNRNVWDKGPAMLDMMERHARPAMSGRRQRTIWTPSLGRACGISEFVKNLVDAMRIGVQSTATLPDLKRVQLLQIEHENSLFNDQELTQALRQAKQAGVQTVVSEHSVDPRARPWEADARSLVSLSARGADMLRARWPAKTVEHIPHGCFTWFPPRKARRGKVIGAFGFLGPHKGFYQLLDVLRQLPGTELLLFSHCDSPATLAKWQAACKGLPVRHISSYLPTEEVARRLAAEADALAFWYEARGHVSVSGAAHIGLASGVPVLTSNTTWFEDIKQACYQPADLVEGMARLLDDSALREQLTGAAREYCEAHSWSRIADRYLNLWRGLLAH
jgi:glycosyltransferase involved in cell wall biosynthesis